MPKRSNAFQSLIHRFESILHGSGATVEESAMVHNPAAGKAEEIDILITFEIGGRSYRTGVAVRERSRKGDKDWIRSLAKQRDQIGLDRIVAVHSRGFTQATNQLAESEHVELVHPSHDDTRLRDSILPVDGLQVCRQRILRLEFDMFTDSLETAQEASQAVPEFLVVAGRSQLPMADVNRIVSDAISNWAASQLFPPSDRVDQCRCLEFVMPLSTGTCVKSRSGQQFFASSLRAKVELQCVWVKFNKIKAYEYRGKQLFSAENTSSDGKSHLTVCQTADEDKSHVMAEIPMTFRKPTTSLTIELPIDQRLQCD